MSSFNFWAQDQKFMDIQHATDRNYNKKYSVELCFFIVLYLSTLMSIQFIDNVQSNLSVARIYFFCM